MDPSHATPSHNPPQPPKKEKPRGEEDTFTSLTPAVFVLRERQRVCTTGGRLEVLPSRVQSLEGAGRMRRDGRHEPPLLVTPTLVVSHFRLEAVQFNWLLKSGGALVYDNGWVKMHLRLRLTTDVHLLLPLSEISVATTSQICYTVNKTECKLISSFVVSTDLLVMTHLPNKHCWVPKL